MKAKAKSYLIDKNVWEKNVSENTKNIETDLAYSPFDK